jgi:hypothetical protein
MEGKKGLKIFFIGADSSGEKVVGKWRIRKVGPKSKEVGTMFKEKECLQLKVNAWETTLVHL